MSLVARVHSNAATSTWLFNFTSKYFVFEAGKPWRGPLYALKYGSWTPLKDSIGKSSSLISTFSWKHSTKLPKLFSCVTCVVVEPSQSFFRIKLPEALEKRKSMLQLIPNRHTHKVHVCIKLFEMYSTLYTNNGDFQRRVLILDFERFLLRRVYATFLRRLHTIFSAVVQHVTLSSSNFDIDFPNIRAQKL